MRLSPQRILLLALAGLFLAAATAPSAAAAPTSETDARLKQILERFPKADLDGDGVLTADEARQARQRLVERRGGESAEPQAPGQSDPRGPKPTAENVKYGPHERNVLDFWKAETDAPAPLVVFIHGGGFVGGDKSKVRGNKVLTGCLEAGISFASINYRFREHAPIQDIVRDCARAIQFLRTKAKEWNIDPTRVASYGGSAGAGTSLWLAFHDDLADPDAADPVLRQSSRLTCAGCLNGQASYDLREWETIVGPPPDGARKEAEILDFYHFKDKAASETPEAERIMKDMSMLSLISAGDSPVFLFCAGPNTDPKDRGHYVHHPRHAIAIRDRCLAMKVGVECVLRDDLAKGDGDQDARLLAFFIKHLKPKPAEVKADAAQVTTPGDE
ncbi:MAG: alpha/beta hydrolase [Planctomycetes bacterium]|nr:alpha/beta hydrolase [Planctomycetota bacterium]